MKGDFSWFDPRPADNYTGVLEQQGRVRLDRDGNAAEEIARGLRTLMGRDAFGPGRVAVPAAESDSLRVTAAETDGAAVSVTVEGGRAWVDGVPFFLAGPATEAATYLPPPFQPETSADSVVAGVRDAVILEVWEDAVSAFQAPETLLEPALGGVDTTERVKVFHRLRLRRLAEDEDCASIGPSLRDDPDALGRLTVTPSPAIVVAGDCPVEAGGGYSGDGHRLYCVEIAPPDSGGARFVWSRFGGGLVGRGRYDGVANRITVTHNLPMIAAAGVSGFHLQALAEDAVSGAWTVAFEATVSFTDGALDVTGASGSWPAAAGAHAFFRLWDGIGAVADFDGGDTDLTDGIRLRFDPETADGSNYRAGDRWLFPARAAGTAFDPSTWPAGAPPMAIRRRRAPLAILTWPSAPPATLTAPDGIADCRDGFQPLTEGCHCCTVTVGDGRRTHGDVDSIEAAIARLPAAGGRICLLPGLHETNAVIRDRAAIRITGCGRHSRVTPRPGAREAPIFHVIDSESVTLDSMDLISLTGVAVLAESRDDDALRQFTVADCRILACIRAVQVEGGSETAIRGNRIRMLDRRGAGVAVYLTGEDARIEDNDIGVVPVEATPRPPDRPDDPDAPDDPADPCADADLIYANLGFFVGFAEFVFGFTLTAITPPPYRALGGVQIGAGAERIAILDNRILGGAGNGITLGGSHLAEDSAGDGADGPLTQDVTLAASVIGLRGTVTGPDGAPAAGATLRISAPSGASRTFVTDSAGGFETAGDGEAGAHRFAAVDPAFGVDGATIADRINFGAGSLVIMRIALNRQRAAPDPALGFLYAVRIEDNDIAAMGLNGVGTPPPAAVLCATEPQRGSSDLAAAPRFAATRAAAVNPLLARLGQPVVDLTIRNNRITRNLRTPFTSAMRNAARTQGFGGISLGLCETVTIDGNRIEANGRRHVDPVCGVFMLLGEQVEITGNLIRDNGPFVTDEAAVEGGQRGAVTGIFLSRGIDELVGAGALTGAKPALRLHDNVAQQPMGRALTAIAAGPVSVVANHLTAERSATAPLDLLAGAALLFSLSGVGALPSGGCLVADNQIRLGPGSGAFIAVALAAAEDVGLDSNQIDALQDGLRGANAASMLNTLVYAATARCTGNRFRERTLDVERALQVSLISTTTRMNVTSLNQGDHCIFAADQSAPPRLVDAGNLVLDSSFCERVQGAAAGAARIPVLGVATLQSARIVAAPQETAEARSYGDGFGAALAALNGWQAARLADAADLKASSRALLVNETARLAARTTTRADTLASSRARTAAAVAVSDRLRAAEQVTATQPARTATEAGIALQGRVAGAAGTGVAARELRLADSDGNPIAGVAAVRTDARGGYVFSVDPGVAERNRDVFERGVTVVAAAETEGGDPVVSERIPVAAGAATIAPTLTLATAAPRAAAGPVPSRAEGPAGAPVAEQPLARPVLSGAARLDAAAGRVSPLLRVSRPPAGQDR